MRMQLQFELYSARVRQFEVLGRQSHPRTDGVGSEFSRALNRSQWKHLGNFTGGWAGPPTCACVCPQGRSLTLPQRPSTAALTIPRPFCSPACRS